MSRVASCFARRETRLTCRDMVNGFLMELEDRNCWTMAEAAGHATPYKMQHLLSRASCDDRAMSEETAAWAAGHLAAGHDPGDVVLIVDETADEKSSADCAGASRQYSGTVGGTALCQVMVTLTLASPDGHALIGRSLYLPEDWAADEERRELAGIPEEVMFASKPELAGGCSRTLMTGASAPGSSPATRSTAAVTCAGASGNAASATCWPSARTTRSRSPPAARRP